MKPALARGGSAAQWIDAPTAAELLGVKTATLYAYVTREGLRTMRKPGSKENLYHHDDVQQLAARRRPSEAVQARAERSLRLGGGGAVLRTSICALGPDGPSYRGHLAIDLVRSQRSFEDCVELLWTGVLPTRPVAWAPVHMPAPLRAFVEGLRSMAPNLGSPRLMALLLEGCAACASASRDVDHGTATAVARHLMQVMATGFRLLAPQTEHVEATEALPFAQWIALHCAIAPTKEALHALDACLILCADHELAPATFAARVAASAGADVFSCAASALGAFEGSHGVGCDAAEALLRGASSPMAYVARLREQEDRQHPLPGYGHPLYPAGDPRGRVLLQIARDLDGRGGLARAALEAVEFAAAELQLPPNLAIGLAAVAIALRMPPRSAGMLMALGRCAGWMAHVFEQRLSGVPLRPRARYVGPPVRE